MPSLTVFDLLAVNHVVGDLPTAWLHGLAAAGRPVYRSTGVRLFRQDAPAERFWLLHSGSVVLDFHVPGRGDIVVEHLGPGEIVGWSWARPPYRWRFGAVVASDIQAVEFDAAQVRTLIAEDRELGREFTGRLLDVLAGRLQASRQRLVELYAYPGSPS